MEDTTATAIRTAFEQANIPKHATDFWAENASPDKFTNHDGTPNTEAIGQLIERVAAYAPPRQPGPNLHQGNLGQPTSRQLTRDDVRSMTPGQIEAARENGQLNDLIEGRN